MKKILCNILCVSLILSMFFYGSIEPYYADTGVSLGVSSSSIKIGEEVSVTVSIPSDYSATIDVVFPANMLSFQSASTSEIGKNQVANGRITVSLSGILNLTSVTIKFKAIGSGNGTIGAEVIKAGNTMTEESVNWSNVSKGITVANQTIDSGNGGGTTEPQKSGDNSLSSLKLSSGTLSPSFKYNVTKYTATVGYDVTKVVVSAKTSNEKATIESVTGNGTVNLEVGENTIQVVVRAENGVKATYTIVVTRKAQDTTDTPDPSESESTSESETTTPEVNEILQWNGEQLQVPETIPAEIVPTGFESTSLVVNGQQMTGLSFTKGDLKVLYLNNTNGAGSLYVYDEAQQTIYPFIKLTSEKGYVMVLLPDEQNAPAPEGFVSCTFSIEGKGLISAYQLKDEVPAGTEEDSTISWNLFGAETFYAAEPKAGDFYLIYCMNDAGEKGWYMYDSVEGTFLRYFASAYSIQTGGEASEPSDEQDKYAELEKELETAKMTQYIIIGIALAVAIILIIVIVVLVLKNRSKEDDFFEGYEEDEDEDEDEEYFEKEVEETSQNAIQETVVEENVVEETESEVYVDTMDEIPEDDEMEIEFYEMEPETVAETVEVDTTEGDDDEIEFYNMEELLVKEVESIEEEVSENPVVEAEAEVIAKPEPVIQRRERVVDPTSKLSSMKEDDDDLEFIDFE